MDSLKMHYLIGNVTATGQNKNRQMKASSNTSVAVAERIEENKKIDKWWVEPEIGPGKIVTFKSVEYPDQFLGYKNSQLLCTAFLQTDNVEFKLEPAGTDGGDDVFYILPAVDTKECPQSYLTMDDPRGDREITLTPKLSSNKHKQKWKFNKSPSDNIGSKY